LQRVILLNKSEDEELEGREMNETELANLFAGLFCYKEKKNYMIVWQ